MGQVEFTIFYDGGCSDMVVSKRALDILMTLGRAGVKPSGNQAEYALRLTADMCKTQFPTKLLMKTPMLMTVVVDELCFVEGR